MKDKVEIDVGARVAHARGLAIGLASAVAVFAASPAYAELPKDKFWIEGGYFDAGVDTNVQISSKTADTIGADIDFEKDLDFRKSKGLPIINAAARLGGGFIVGLDYYRLHRAKGFQLNEDIVFDDVTYPVDAEINSSFDSDIYKLSLGYLIHDGSSSRLGAGVGVHITKLSITLEGEGTVDGTNFQVERRRREVTAPMPTIGLFGELEVAPRVVLGGRAEYLSLKVKDYKGELGNVQASVRYAVNRNISIGVLYRYVDYTIKINKDDYRGRVSYKFHGPGIFLRASF